MQTAVVMLLPAAELDSPWAFLRHLSLDDVRSVLNPKVSIPTLCSSPA